MPISAFARPVASTSNTSSHRPENATFSGGLQFAGRRSVSADNQFSGARSDNIRPLNKPEVSTLTVQLSVLQRNHVAAILRTLNIPGIYKKIDGKTGAELASMSVEDIVENGVSEASAQVLFHHVAALNESGVPLEYLGESIRDMQYTGVDSPYSNNGGGEVFPRKSSVVPIMSRQTTNPDISRQASINTQNSVETDVGTFSVSPVINRQTTHPNIVRQASIINQSSVETDVGKLVCFGRALFSRLSSLDC